jgi:hypothetical protein
VLHEEASPKALTVGYEDTVGWGIVKFADVRKMEEMDDTQHGGQE